MVHSRPAASKTGSAALLTVAVVALVNIVAFAQVQPAPAFASATAAAVAQRT